MVGGRRTVPSGADGVLVGHGEQVSFLDVQFAALEHHLLHVGQHVFETLGLFGDARHVDEFFSGKGHFKI